MFNQPITFDSFIRSICYLLLFVCGIYVLDMLSGVLLPFFIAWLLAYLMYPLVKFLQYKCHLRWRILAIVVAFIIVLAALSALVLLVVIPTIEEFSKLSGLVSQFSQRYLSDTNVAPYIERFLAEFREQYHTELISLIHQDNVLNALQSVFGYCWDFLAGTINFVIGLVGSIIVLLYMFFILQDYESITQGWIEFIPKKRRPFAAQLVADVESGMNSYFRGQATVAFCVGVLFSIGFLIIGFPMAIGLGMFIGFLNLVPYLQTVGFIPTILLSLLKAADTGENFWWILIPALIVFAVVQSIQDLFLVPKIMGDAMGLNPAVILLSLSVWGYLLGFIGLIIALPLTTLVISYYRRFVLEDNDEET